jgi:hypothetical protein
MRAKDRHLQRFGPRMGVQKHSGVVSVRGEKTVHRTRLRGPKRYQSDGREMPSRLRSGPQQQMHRYTRVPRTR